MIKDNLMKEIYSNLTKETTCYSFLRDASKALPFKGVSFIEIPEVLPAKVNSTYIFLDGDELDEIEIYLSESVRKKLKEAIWTPDNFLIDPTKLDSQEIVTSFGIKTLARVPIFVDCNTIAGVIYFAHDKEIKEWDYDLFANLNSIGITFSRLYFREFSCQLPGAYAEVDVLQKMMNSNHYLIASVIHDLSNPLTVIYLEAQRALMCKGVQLEKSLTNIEDSIDHIYKIIESTKKFFSKNKEKEDLQTLSVSNVIDFINTEYREQLDEKSLTLNSSGHDLEFIAFKKTFFNTVMGSLLSNSIRFSPNEAIIKIWAREVEQSVEIVIEDSAGGFPAEVLENIKGNFKSKPSPSTSGEIGSGMGLVLAKSYLELMNGTLTIEPLKEGSRIILRMRK